MFWKLLKLLEKSFNLKSVGLYFLFLFAITIIWRYYEISAFGKAEEDIFDTFIAVILSVSLSLNILFYGFLKQNGKEKKEK